MKTFLSQTTNLGLFLFVLLSAYNIYKDVTLDRKYIQNIQNIQNQMQRINKNSQMILEIQKERGLTSIYFENKSQEHLNKVNAQRKITSKITLNAANELKNSLNNIRKQADKDEKNKLEVFYAYSELIRSLLLDIKYLTFFTDNNLLKNELIIYNDLHSLQEFLGLIRAKVGVVLSAGTLTQEDKLEIKRRNILFEHHLEDTFINDIITSRKYTKSISKTKCLKKSLLFSKSLENELNHHFINLSALEWFELSTCAVTRIHSFVQEQRTIINTYVENEIKNAKEDRIKRLIFWLLGAVILLVFVLMSFKRSKELLKEQTLLRNYKKAIDYASIVSTTDKNGVITYANKNLCDISGYSEIDLIGKTHNIIRHPDTAKELFTDMWKTIQNGKNWHGLLKNKTKDGGFYWVDSSIVPILDNQKNLVEYISIRQNVTDIILLYDEIQDTQRELIYRLGEAVESRSKESGNHIKRVAHFSQLLAKLSKLSQEECDIIFAASSMHDVGKIAIADAILLKPASLNDAEWKVMQTHAEIGYNLFKDSRRPILQAAASIAYEHHERYDGKGYPRGIQGEDICIFGRIVAIADVFDALCSKRTYKEAWNLDDVLILLKEESGKQFDPKLIKLFIDNLDSFLAIQDKYK